MNNGIPQKLVNYNVYNAGRKLIGRQAETELPKFEAMTSTLSGAGFLGEMDSPNTGHFGSIRFPLTFRTLDEESAQLAEPKAHTLTLYADQDSYDEVNGVILHRQLKVVVRGFPIIYEGGKVNPGNPTETKVELEISYIKIENNGKMLVELDKFNYIYVVNGVDYMAAVRNNI